MALILRQMENTLTPQFQSAIYLTEPISLPFLILQMMVYAANMVMVVMH